MTKPWLNDILPCSRQSSTNGSRCLPNQTPMTPSMEDTLKPQNGRVGIGGVQASGAKIGRRNSTGLGHAVRARSAARVIGGARAGKGSRAVGAMRPRHAAGMRCRNPESGHPNIGGRNQAGPLATPRNRVGGAPSSSPHSKMLNFLKLKEEVVKHAQSYIWRRSLTAPSHRIMRP